MSSQAPRGRQSGGTGRSGGGRALMLFGVLLAILSGVLVIFIVSQATQQRQRDGLACRRHTAHSDRYHDGSTNIKADFGVEKYPGESGACRGLCLHH